LPNTQAGEAPLVGCLLIQYIHSYPPYMEATSPIYNSRMWHAVVTGNHATHTANIKYQCSVSDILLKQFNQ